MTYDEIDEDICLLSTKLEGTVDGQRFDRILEHLNQVEQKAARYKKIAEGVSIAVAGVLNLQKQGKL